MCKLVILISTLLINLLVAQQEVLSEDQYKITLFKKEKVLIKKGADIRLYNKIQIEYSIAHDYDTEQTLIIMKLINSSEKDVSIPKLHIFREGNLLIKDSEQNLIAPTFEGVGDTIKGVDNLDILVGQSKSIVFNLCRYSYLKKIKRLDKGSRVSLEHRFFQLKKISFVIE